ncbi:MAG: hypothetical protein ACR2NP_12985 [Pirellulaceae bacterium]
MKFELVPLAFLPLARIMPWWVIVLAIALGTALALALLGKKSK